MKRYLLFSNNFLLCKRNFACSGLKVLCQKFHIATLLHNLYAVEQTKLYLVKLVEFFINVYSILRTLASVYKLVHLSCVQSLLTVLSTVSSRFQIARGLHKFYWSRWLNVWKPKRAAFTNSHTFRVYFHKHLSEKLFINLQFTRFVLKKVSQQIYNIWFICIYISSVGELS